MRLNPDCIRDILLIVEKYATYSNDVEQEIVFQELEDTYNHEEILYHIRQCEASGLFLKVQYFFGGFSIVDLSPEGHQFVNDIRQDTNWNRTKEVAKVVRQATYIDIVSRFTAQVWGIVYQSNALSKIML